MEFFSFTVSAIILAAGKSERMGIGRNKVFAPLFYKPVIEWSLDLFQAEESVGEIIIAVSDDDLPFLKALVAKFNKIKALSKGGETRQGSVSNALTLTSANYPYIAVHDGARPLLSREELHKVIMTANKDRGAVLAVPVKDTIKEVEEGNLVKRTLTRDGLYLAQTPQVFPRDLLLEADNNGLKANFIATDDASLVENIGGRVEIVLGSYENIKITTQEDILFAEMILKKRG